MRTVVFVLKLKHAFACKCCFDVRPGTVMYLIFNRVPSNYHMRNHSYRSGKISNLKILRQTDCPECAKTMSSFVIRICLLFYYLILKYLIVAGGGR